MAARTKSSTDLAALLEERAGGKDDYWRFSRTSRTRTAPEPYQYPAMMVPSMQGELLSVLCQYRGERPTVADFFVGAGTTLAESMRLGCAFVGCDINPLAILLSTVKAEALYDLDVVGTAHEAIVRARRDRRGIDQNGAWVTKWYRRDVARDLARLRRAIALETDVRSRRTLWVALAEVARTSGNMQIRRPKLQTRPRSEIARHINVYERFWAAASAVASARAAQTDDLRAANVAVSGRYTARIFLSRADVQSFEWPNQLPRAGIVITSPPYGDNHTTMPYGQHSYLPLRWIDCEDIDNSVPADLIAASKTLDTRSLGGSRRLDHERVALAASRSPTLAASLKRLVDRTEPWSRVAAFFSDMAHAWGRVIPMTQPDAHLVLTIGDRTVSGLPIPTTRIVEELLSNLGLRTVARWERTIQGKRLAPRNTYAANTINDEAVVIMQRR